MNFSHTKALKILWLTWGFTADSLARSSLELLEKCTFISIWTLFRFPILWKTLKKYHNCNIGFHIITHSWVSVRTKNATQQMISWMFVLNYEMNFYVIPVRDQVIHCINYLWAAFHWLYTWNIIFQIQHRRSESHTDRFTDRWAPLANMYCSLNTDTIVRFH